jgi:hypothetical protein
MPQPLPAIEVPDYAPTLNAFRQGYADKQVREKQDTMKQAGGLAAAGDYTGARSALYAGGQFDEARSMSQEMRTMQDHLRTLDNDKLTKMGQMQGLMGNLTDAISNDPNPGAALDRAKAELKARGYDASSVSLDQLPMLKQQSVSVQQAIENEQKNRELDINDAKAKAALLNGGKLSESQAKARAYGLELEQSNKELPQSLKKGKIPLGEIAESPLGNTTNSLAMNDYTPGFVKSDYLNKQQKQFLQNAEQFVSVLTYGRSGAQISAPEFSRAYRVYFPQPGDDIRTRRLKAAARRKVIDGYHIMGNAVPADNAKTEDSNEGFKVLGVE